MSTEIGAILASREGLTAVSSVVSFVAGFLASRLTMSRFERASIEQKRYENGTALAKAHAEKYDAYTAALNRYIKREIPLFDDFYSVATAGDAYFGQLMQAAEAVLGGNVTERQAATFVESCRRCAQETLPLHFSTLKRIAEKNGFDWSRPMRRSDYAAIFDVVESRGHLSPIPVVEASRDRPPAD